LKHITVKLILSVFIFISYNYSSARQNYNTAESTTFKSDSIIFDNSVVYQTDNLIIEKLSDHAYLHTSFLNTNDFGRVPCNGMIVVNENEAVVFDTPADDESSAELINYINNNSESKIIAVIPTHFHEDCIGGLKTFNNNSIPVYASSNTLELIKNENPDFNIHVNTFEDSLALNIGSELIYAEYFGEGHTKDNVIGYFPDDNIIFGGCLIKETGASKGYLGDANVSTWSETVLRIKQKYPDVKIVIPGHGKCGGTELFDYTIELFEY
jgi:metallo-beta-lactamase class B